MLAPPEEAQGVQDNYNCAAFVRDYRDAERDDPDAVKMAGALSDHGRAAHRPFQLQKNAGFRLRPGSQGHLRQ